LSGWENVIGKTYGHKIYYLMAIEDDPQDVVGILPLVHIKHLLFGNTLISLPFLDYGGILADDEKTERALLAEAIKLGRKSKASCIELRHIKPLPFINDQVSDQSAVSHEFSTMNFKAQTSSHKVRMLFPVQDDSETLMKSFKSKLRSQVRKPIKEGCTVVVGSMELLDDFYQIFASNMRNLGSPVHPKELFKYVLTEFPEEARICTVYKGSQPLAASLVIGFQNTLENPWASSLREYSRLSPNMLLYWTMIEHACNSGYEYFDFGRSSPEEGTYKFKQQWGAEPNPLYWHYISLNSQPVDFKYSQQSRYGIAIQFWKHLPIPITKVIGPRIRKYIGL
jgi:FemAB-related protein (PEP-CTERM system-associated)